MRALTEKQREALTELARGDQPTLYHRQYAKTLHALIERGLVFRDEAQALRLTPAGHQAATPQPVGRKRVYTDAADKQMSHRRRKEQQEFNNRMELEKIKSAAVSVLKQRGDYIEAEGTQGIINGLYRLFTQAEAAGKGQANNDFQFPIL
jgi:hypothetical protein